MSKRGIGAALVTVIGFVQLGSAADPANAKPSLSELSLQVAALRTIYDLELTEAQIQALQKLSRQTMGKAPEKPGVASDKYREALKELRDALAAADDPDQIELTEAKLAELMDAEEPELDDGIEITTAARRSTLEALRVLKPAQVITYLSNNRESFIDPLDALMSALNQSQNLADAEWKELVEETVEEVGWLLAGVDGRKVKAMEQRIEKWLGQVRDTKEADFKAKRADLEQSARQMVSQVPPTQVLHHIVEHTLAELLSNPQVGAAFEARLKK